MGGELIINFKIIKYISVNLSQTYLEGFASELFKVLIIKQNNNSLTVCCK